MLDFFSSRRSRKELDIILTQELNADSPLDQRLEWLSELLTWIFTESPLVIRDLDFSTGHPQALRVKWLLHVLERNPNWKISVQTILTSIAAETSIFDLLVMAGLHQQSGLFSEFVERVQRRFLPRPPDDKNLELLFTATFQKEADAASIHRLDLKTLEGLIELFSSSERNSFGSWKQDSIDAILHLAIQISALGSQSSIRKRTKSFEEKITGKANPFVRLQLETADWTRSSYLQTQNIEICLEDCEAAIEHVYSHMDEHGVSVNLVYQLERIKALLRRLKNLLHLFKGSHFSPLSIQTLSGSLVFESVHSRSIRALFDDNTALIAKKIAENSAETGEHYIAKNPSEEAALLKSAIGGGAITAVTTIFKYLIIGLPGSPFFLSLLGAANYSISFMTIQLQGFSLATKQPAMTAAALADQIILYEEVDRNLDLEPVVDEMIRVLRSQTIAVIGNIAAVTPGVFLLCGTYSLITSTKFLSKEAAASVIEHFSIFGATPIFAAWTGVLLFTSSLIAGWFYHWVLFRELPQAFSRSRRLIGLIGPERTRKFSVILKRGAAGFAANLSLGMLLGLSPAFFDFLGVPLDVRHVTLSTGSLVAAVMTLGIGVGLELKFWFAILGILSMAVLNLLVSFILALGVALRSKKIPFSTALTIVKIFVLRILKQPTLLFRSSR